MKAAKLSFSVLGMLLVGVAGLNVGCGTLDRPPAVPKTNDGKVVKTVSPGDAEETQLAQKLVDAHAVYYARLVNIRDYYNRIGDRMKFGWAENELKNLRHSYTFTYDGVTATTDIASPNLSSTDELSLAEPVVTARKAYVSAMDELAKFYTERGMTFKVSLVKNMQDRYDPIRTYMYFLQAEVPPEELRGTDSIVAADSLYNQALALHKEGKIAPAITVYPKEREALVMFLQLVHEYPTSTRIGYAAYYIADIYKEYFNEDYRACLWYERAWEWEPTIAKPARFQAAVVYDLRLHHRNKAVELYKQVIQKETFNESNVDFARHRLAQLTQEPMKP